MDSTPVIQPKPIDDETSGIPSRPRRKLPIWRIIIGAACALLLAVIVTIIIYVQALRPVDPGDSSVQTVEIVSGMMPSEIAHHLKESDIIRSQAAFDVHTRLVGVRNKLRAGVYEFTKQMSTQEVVESLVGGPVNEEFEITFLPGATLADSRQVLIAAGFDGAEVDNALSATYDHPLLASKPSSADLEGYIFGETHRFTKGTSVQAVLERFFDDYYEIIEREGLIAKYRAQGLSLYEGITLASIIQRESGGDDKEQIAQIFLLRLDRGMELGSDVTYQYIADKEGKPRDVNYDSPYNTRRYPGLPPGPIASPGVGALTAVGSPASGDYLYFLSGDDDATYYARTLAEHEANIRNHCQQKCQII